MSNISDSSGRVGIRRIAVVVSGWPRLSESFALNELLALQSAGMLAAVFATKLGDSAVQHPAIARLDADVRFLADGTAEQQGAELAGSLSERIDGVHGYFAHQPAAVAREAAAILGVPFGFSVHAKDPRKVESTQLADRARAASCVVACNSDVAGQLRAVGADPILVPHGVDVAAFTPSPRTPDGRIELLAVGRLVAKKGFGVLIASTRLLECDWRLRIVGEGPFLEELQEASSHVGVADRVEFLGPRTHAELPSLYHGADIVVVPSVIDSSGDRDGLPNVVLEAMACGLPVIGSDVAAIPTAIEHRVTGMLVEPGTVHGLAKAINELAEDAELRTQLGINARSRAERQFGLTACTTRFLSILEAAYA
jgi:glycosyltransferase involved in cell wall biosynthesis